MARQLLTESLLLVALGGVQRGPLHWGRRDALGSWAQIESNLQPDGIVLWFTLSVLLLLALVFGLAPLRAAMSSGPEMVLRSSATVSQSSSQKVRAGNAVIVTQIAMCVVLLVGAGLAAGNLAQPVEYAPWAEAGRAAGLRRASAACPYEGREHCLLCRTAAEAANDSRSGERFDGFQSAWLWMVQQQRRCACGWPQTEWA
jgi:hypothetical protein